MADADPKIAELDSRLNRLVRTQIDFQLEITRIREELQRLRLQQASLADTPDASPSPYEVKEPIPRTELPHAEQPPPRSQPGPSQTVPPSFGQAYKTTNAADERPENAVTRFINAYADSARADLEKFIGENLISKIGILILILGVAVGAKYAIDSGWISPVIRVALGYLMAFGLIGFAVRLKSKYHNFSSVLFSGGMAILYFITYFAYASYLLIAQPAAFGLMVIFTVITVAGALYYDRQVIAHIGLVGAYAVPFLLSTGSGNYLFLFTYMAIVNVGILVIAVRKYWKPLFFTSSGFTWLIFGAWFATKYSPSEHLPLALIFLGVFFSTFYATKIVHGIMQPASSAGENVVSIFATAFIFYAFCLAVVMSGTTADGYAVLFSYLAAFSLAILITSFRLYGRVLVYLAFPFTWIIFGSWFAEQYPLGENFVLAWVFASVLFLIYYGATLVYRLLTGELGTIESVVLVLTNSFVFYGFGYSLLDSREALRAYEGLFTVGHAAFHYLVAVSIETRKNAVPGVVQTLSVLILTFATMAIPIQFDGSVVTLMWTVEAAILFWFGRKKGIGMFEYFSYPLMGLAVISLMADWAISYAARTPFPSEFNLKPFLNGDFVTAAVFVAAFAFIYVTNRSSKQASVFGPEFVRQFGIALAGCGLLVLYNMFRVEIGNFYHLEMASFSAPGLGSLDADAPPAIRRLELFNVIWQINYTAVFLTALNFVNLARVRSQLLAKVGGGLSILPLVLFLTVSMQMFHQLREAYMVDGGGIMNIAIRYISYAIAAGLIFSLFRYASDETLTRSVPEKTLSLGFDALVHLSLLITASCELINLMGQLHIPDATRFGLSILWGFYALFLIILGIAGNKKHLRIAAISLLALTLVKLFLYDVADLPTIPKTILLISIGLLMLIVSFLYNKYKGSIFKPEPVEAEP